MPVSQMREKVSSGLVVEEAGREADFRRLSKDVTELGFEFFAFWVAGDARAAWDPAKHPDAVSLSDVPGISVVDVEMRHTEWRHYAVGRLSPWIDPDSPDPRVADLSAQALRQEMAFVRYLDLTAAVVELRRPDSPALAALVREIYWTKHGHSMMLWTLVPLSVPPSPAHGDAKENGAGDPGEAKGEGKGAKQEDGWHWWYRFRTATGNHHKVTACPRFTADVPGESPEELALITQRWCGEILSSVWLDSEVFVEKGRLSPAHLHLLQSLYKQGVQVLLRPSGGVVGGQAGRLWETLNDAWTGRPEPDTITKFAEGYEDHLQTPLQPLSDHLEASTYEVFEKDPVKYRVYGEAVEAALRDKFAAGHQRLVLMVLGAGRGPLVAKCREAMRALSLAPAKVRLMAVEKNPFAAVTLRHRNRKEWGGQVEVVETDMRELGADGPKADIVVSELLGSFGDNELSPECLDGAASVMGPGCVSIPQSYTSYLAPLHSPRLHLTIRDEMGKTAESVSGSGCCNGSRPLDTAAVLWASPRGSKVSEIFDIPYVVRLHNHFLIAEPQALFSFHHPRQEGDETTNERQGCLSWTAPVDCELMGLAGFFDTVLYGDIRLSIHPASHSADMCSWFPILFPLGRPVGLAKGQTVQARMERRVSEERVWYEWSLVQPSQTRLQNLNGAANAMNKAV